MRPFVFVLPTLLALASPPSSAAAQTGSEANLLLTIFGGTVTGHDLWTIDKQPFSVPDASGRSDTLRLSRTINSSLVLGAAATYFPSPHVGVHAELSYMGLPVDSDCTPLFLNSDVDGGGTNLRRNEQLCDYISAQSPSGGAITIFGGVTLRAASRRSVSPYVRGNLGIAVLSGSTIDMAGAYVVGGSVSVREVITDPKPRRSSLMLGAAAGFTAPLGTGYQIRLEARDLVTSLDRVTGPANGLGIAPRASRLYHHFALTLGLDVVLENKRGRRY
jgi:hypothetical protein